MTKYDCCGGTPEHRTRDGRVAVEYHDALKRVYKVEEKADESSSAPTVITTTEYNGLTTTRSRTIGSSTLFLGSSTRSLDGLTITNTAPANKSTNAADRPVTTSVTAHNSGTGDTVTTTDALGGTSITSYYLDGRIKSRRGTAVADEDHDYDVHNYSSTLHGLSDSKKSYSVPYAGGAAFVQSSRKFDMLGRIMQEVSPASGTTTYAYHPLSASPGAREKLASTTDADGVVVSYGYNAKGEKTTVTRTIPLASGTATLVNTTTRDVVASATLQGTTLGVCFRSSESVGSTTISQSYSEISGLRSGDYKLGVGSTLIVSTRPDTNGLRTKTVTAPDGTRTVTTMTHGLTTSVAEQDSTTTHATFHSTTYGYDALQRPLSVKDSRHTGTMYYGATNATTANVSESGLPLSITDAAGNTTGTGYDLLGRPLLKTLPDSSTINTAYYPTGQTKATWGSQTYPVFYVYDEAGRNVELHTWKTAPTWNTTNIATYSPSGSQLTTWTYSGTTGLLSSKTDAASKTVAYAYTDAGRLRKRTWARGKIARYDYSYGMLVNTCYFTSNTTYANTGWGDDTTTPDVTNIYDELGRLTTVLQYNQSRLDYTYNSDFTPEYALSFYDLNHNGKYEFGAAIVFNSFSSGKSMGYSYYDSLLFIDEADQNPNDLWDIIDSFWWADVSDPAYSYDTSGRLASVTNGGALFEYAYQANSNLLASVTGPQHKVTNTWEASRDVLDVKSNNKLSSGTPVVSSIDYTVNNIGQRTNAARAGAATNSTTWGYDGLGQVATSDDSVNTSDRAYVYDAIGNRVESADGTTTPTGTPNYDSSNALNQYEAVPSVSSLVYDDDGNATSYPLPVAPTALSTLAWDGENRMVSATVGGTTTAYMYDALGRRIAETTGTAQKVFAYEGWNCVADYAGTTGGTTFTPHVYNTWGLDLSGSLQGAGGVGGLLMQKFASGALSGNNYYPLYDGNGNVTEYIDDFATTAAHFEYDPFGREIESSGTNKDEFRYRFSTKPLDAATRTYNYGYRSYEALNGRWLSRDPIGERGGVILYGMVKNSPIRYYDILGLDRDTGAESLATLAKEINTLAEKCCVSPSDRGKVKAFGENLTDLLTTLWSKGHDGTAGEPRPDMVGGHFCWDWAIAFKKAADSIYKDAEKQGVCPPKFEFFEGKKRELNQFEVAARGYPFGTKITVSPVHWAVKICVGDCKNDKCCLSIDDGFFERDCVHPSDTWPKRDDYNEKDPPLDANGNPIIPAQDLYPINL